VDFDLSDDQREILGAVEVLLDRHAGAARAIALQRESGYDGALEAALADAGFLDVARQTGEGGGSLEAALIVESVARAAGVCAAGAAALVAPALGEPAVPAPIALATTAAPGPVRYAAHARTLLVIDGGTARRVPLSPGDCPAVASSFGYPMGTVTVERMRAGEALGPGSGERLGRWWRLALAVECVGTMDAALAQTVGYLKTRRQFGRAIGSFQAVQHRLAECAIEIEASRWLVREAAFHDAPAEPVATAAAYALAAAGRVFAETHQLSGAIGFTREHDLHVWSMRLQALRLELGGVAAHRRAVVTSRWGGPAAGGAAATS
jgi:alkylation response protein AidB-like acyl-CoA dehydrogenase